MSTPPAPAQPPLRADHSRCEADPSWVELVLIGGNLAYARTDWFTTLAAQPTGPTIEHLTAWGKPTTSTSTAVTGCTARSNAAAFSADRLRLAPPGMITPLLSHAAGGRRPAARCG